MSLMVADVTEGDAEVAWAAGEASSLDCKNLFVFNKIDKASHEMKEYALRLVE